MKKLLALLMVAGFSASLSACGGVPKCYDELNECGRDTAYTEERTVLANRTKPVVAEPAPVVAPTPAPVVAAPAPAPMPEPAPVVDTKVMTTAEPQFEQKLSK